MLLDVIHSHISSNADDGLAGFDLGQKEEDNYFLQVGCRLPHFTTPQSVADWSFSGSGCRARFQRRRSALAAESALLDNACRASEATTRSGTAACSTTGTGRCCGTCCPTSAGGSTSTGPLRAWGCEAPVVPRLSHGGRACHTLSIRHSHMSPHPSLALVFSSQSRAHLRLLRVPVELHTHPANNLPLLMGVHFLRAARVMSKRVRPLRAGSTVSALTASPACCTITTAST